MATIPILAVVRAARGCCVRLDDVEIRPLAMATVGGGDSIVAMVYVW
jgi:hypothetical protein